MELVASLLLLQMNSRLGLLMTTRSSRCLEYPGGFSHPCIPGDNILDSFKNSSQHGGDLDVRWGMTPSQDVHWIPHWNVVGDWQLLLGTSIMSALCASPRGLREYVGMFFEILRFMAGCKGIREWNWAFVLMQFHFSVSSGGGLRFIFGGTKKFQVCWRKADFSWNSVFSRTHVQHYFH